MTKLRFDWALLPEGWREAVSIEVDAEGMIASVTSDVALHAGDAIQGAALPGMPNLHSHGFQRVMAGLAERRHATDESFWSWRSVMYRVANLLSPEDIEAVTAMAYVEMLEAGFTTVGEFHYLHHDVSGHAYADIAETSVRVISAARSAGIGLTLLPSLYQQGGFGTPPEEGQRRFISTTDQFVRLCHAASASLKHHLPHGKLGVAPHSLRAAGIEAIQIVVDAFKDYPVHIHAAEQAREVEECLAACGVRPVAWLLANLNIDEHWCLIHATHMDDAETLSLAKSRAVAGLCPITEANLGDGIFPATPYLNAKGRFGIGGDSLVQIDVAGELRQFEYSQRLRAQRRTVLTRVGSNGEAVYLSALAGGAQALAQKTGTIAPGYRADIVVLDRRDNDLAVLPPALWLDHVIFTGGGSLIDQVYAAGVPVVQKGRHRNRDAVAMRFRSVLARLIDRL